MKSLASLFTLSFALAAANAQPPDTLWTRTYGSSFQIHVEAIVRSTDGGYYLLGNYRPSGSGFVDAYIIRTSSGGDTIWTRTFGDLEDDYLVAAAASADNGCVAIGGFDTPAGHERRLVHCDEFGNIEMRPLRDDTERSAPTKILSTPDGGFLLLGRDTSLEYDAVYLLKLSATLDSMWSRTYGEEMTPPGIGGAVEVTPQGRILLYLSNGYNLTKSIRCLSDSGTAIWTRDLHLADELHASPRLRSAPDGGWYLCSSMNVFGRNDEIMVVRGSEAGDSLWTQYYGTAAYDDYADDFATTSDTGFVFLYRYSVVRFNHHGDTLWANSFSGPRSLLNPSRVIPLTSGRLIITGETNDSHMYPREFLAEVHGGNLAIESRRSPVSGDFSLTSYPNPFNPTTTISLDVPITAHTTVSVYNLLGREITQLHDGLLSAGSHSFTFDARDRPNGLYFARVQTGSYSTTQKLLLLK